MYNLPIEYVITKSYNINIFNEREVTSMGKVIVTGAMISEIEEIKYKSNMIAGLSTVLSVFLAAEQEDELLIGAIQCLKEEAFRLQYKCNNLLHLAIDN